jgi:hypothetical protein
VKRLVTPGWLACHALAAVLASGCLALGWWQIRRAAGGNTLSWAYAVEWPVFAGFVVFIWVREVRRVLGHDKPVAAAEARREPARRPVLTARRAPVRDDRNDPELAAYNRYLAWLNANPGARPADYPRATRTADHPGAEHIVEERTWAQP